MSTKSKLVKEISSRTSYRSDADRFSLVVLGKEEGNRQTIRMVWAAAWIVIGVLVTREAARPEITPDVQRVLFIFILFWAYYLFRIVRALRWHAVGKEMLMVKGDTLTTKNSFGTIGRSKHWDLSRVEPMRLRERPKGFSSLFEDNFWSTGVGSIELPIAGTPRLFGNRLSLKEAEQVIGVFNRELKARKAE